MTQLASRFGPEDYLSDLLPKEGKQVEIVIQMETMDRGLHWSNKKGETVQVASGTECTILLITQEQKPYELLIDP